MLLFRKHKLSKYQRAYLRKLQKQHRRKTRTSFLNIFRKRISSSDQKTMSYRKKIRKRNTHSSSSSPHTRKPSPQKTKTSKKPLSFFKKVLFVLFLAAFIGFGILFIWFATLNIPDVDNFNNRKISNSTKIYDRTGEILLYDIHENIRRTVVDIKDIDQSALDAIVSIEDHTFYTHNGVVVKSTIRAVFQTIFSKLGLSSSGTAGGSTLTQQVVKNTLLNRDRRITRKMKEWVLAYKIEQQLSKEEILEIYLNEAPYGGTIYGIEEASRVFFGIPASELSVAQSAYLAAIPNLPTFYSPYGQNKDKLDQRQRTVLREMKRYGYLSDAEYREALEEQVEFLPQTESHGKSLHFVQYVRALLEEEYGVDVVENGGLRVVTTLDYELQQHAEQVIAQHIEDVEEVYNASNAGLIAIESETGHIITMVGSRDYFDTEEFDGNFNVTLAKRQPGSSFKPIAYATAFERGYFPETAIFDTETQFNSSCDAFDTTSEDGCYSPNNFDFQFNGPMSFRNALAQSRNIPAIKVLHLAGLSNVIEQARQMGITSLTQSPNFYGLGLVLGGGEVSLLEMVGAYTIFANDGRYNKPTAILEVIDANGDVLETYEQDEQRVLEANAARMVSSILADNDARTPLFGSQSFLYFGSRDVAGKTGTTNDNRDAWLVGYTPQLAVGVWTGNNDNSPMKKGSSISGKPWREYMDEAIKNYERTHFQNYNLPDNFNTFPNMVKGEWHGGTTVYIDTVSGKRATEFTPEETKLAVPIVDPHTILYWINKNNPAQSDTSRADAQFENWEYGVQEYVQENFGDLLDFEITLPDEYDDVHTEDNQIGVFDFRIENIKEQGYLFDETIEVEINLDVIDESDVKMVQYYVNNSFIASIESEPWVFRFKPQDVQYLQVENLLRVIVTNKNDNRMVREQIFYSDTELVPAL